MGTSTIQNRFSRHTIAIVLSACMLTSAFGRVGEIAPDFSLEYFTGLAHPEGEFNLYEQEGSVVILEWFGWWCPFCPPFAQQVENEILSSFGNGNVNGIPLTHVSLHVEGPDVGGIRQFANAYNLSTVVMDVNRDAFRALQLAGSQPYLVVLNGVVDAEGLQQWEILYEVDGFGGGPFPGAEIRAAVNRVNSTGSGSSVTPPSAPEVDTSVPFQTLPVENGLKQSDAADSEFQGFGWIWDVNFPHIYSFSIAAEQEALVIENPALKGWLYVNPNQTQIGDGLFAYVYATEEWIWIPTEGLRDYLSVTSPNEGNSGWRRFAPAVERPSVDTTEDVLASLVIPVPPVSWDQTNPFLSLPLEEGKRLLTDSPFASLGSVDDSAYPLVISDGFVDKAMGNTGYLSIGSTVGTENGSLIVYSHDDETWVWIPSGTDGDTFQFQYLSSGENGWKKASEFESVTPDVDAIAQFEETTRPIEELPLVTAGNPFASLELVEGLKDTSKIDGLNIGWVDDSRYPYVYAFNLDELRGVVSDPETDVVLDSETQVISGGWLFFDDSATAIEGGYWGFQYGSNTWIWMPTNRDGRVLFLGASTGGVGGWSNRLGETNLPDLATRNAVSSLELPELNPSFGDQNPFINLPIVGGLKLTEEAPSLITGLGWINDESFPLTYSYRLANEQLMEQTVDEVSSLVAKENAGWVHIQSQWSNIGSGILTYLYAEKEWRWYPAEGNGWYFSLTNHSAGNSGWVGL